MKDSKEIVKECKRLSHDIHNGSVYKYLLDTQKVIGDALAYIEFLEKKCYSNKKIKQKLFFKDVSKSGLRYSTKLRKYIKEHVTVGSFINKKELWIEVNEYINSNASFDLFKEEIKKYEKDCNLLFYISPFVSLRINEEDKLKYKKVKGKHLSETICRILYQQLSHEDHVDFHYGQIHLAIQPYLLDVTDNKMMISKALNFLVSNRFDDWDDCITKEDNVKNYRIDLKRIKQCINAIN